MATYEVTADLVINVIVKVTVEAADKDAAIAAASAAMPDHLRLDGQRDWKAKIDLRSPKGVNIKVVRAYHLTQASGGEKARKVGP